MEGPVIYLLVVVRVTCLQDRANTYPQVGAVEDLATCLPGEVRVTCPQGRATTYPQVGAVEDLAISHRVDMVDPEVPAIYHQVVAVV